MAERRTPSAEDATKRSGGLETKLEQYKAAKKPAVDCTKTKCCMSAGGQCNNYDPDHCFPHNCGREYGGK